MLTIPSFERKNSMGVNTTLGVSRNDALLALAQVEYGSLSDTEIENRLDEVVARGLYNVSIRSQSRDSDAWNLGRLVGIEMGSPD